MEYPLGLSPRLRGNQDTMSYISSRLRSIPAPAGEPDQPSGTTGHPGVYPRACGGTLWRSVDAESCKGLSPRLRGNQGHPYLRDRHHGSIPAPAGEPPRVGVMKYSIGVYPRACGGTLRRWSASTPARGLSPRLRGNHFAVGAGGPVAGSIPAPAGEPVFPIAPNPTSRVYPRACGGTCKENRQGIERKGLSPRLRGNRRHPYLHLEHLGSIPAPAGEP